ncbi:peptidoglycan-binding domain-containing protein [Streptomyces sp. NPDC012600]|uniref:Peptidoglycan-binding domain-containing protein n=1 Tax=Streptomyces stephensoniae TaxID=3375367 RepID=A0ABU2VW62_9ACTN|nr:peptidoglycan-binding domain-containing protein [Streptomyces griseus]MDT0489844.1 peptidoglycan-binding domain-containing protein [Streptomyces griseus]
MRLSTWKRSFVSSVAAAGIVVGTLAGASGTAAAAPADTKSATATKIAPQAVQNLGLSVRQAKGIQRRHQEVGYNPGAIDGQLGTGSWKAIQRALRDHHGYAGAIDGIVGPNTIRALQRSLKANNWGYTGAIDGIAGPGTRAAFARWANWCVDRYNY